MNPEQVRLLVDAALREVLPGAMREALPSWYAIGTTLLLVVLVVALAAWGAAYLQTKAQRRAIREDLEKIEGAAEKIKAEVAGGLWLRQKRWDLRRDIYSQLLTGIDELRYAGRVMAGADKGARERSAPGDEAARKEHQDAYSRGRQRALAALRSVATAEALSGMLLGPTANAALNTMTSAWDKEVEHSPLGIVKAWPELLKALDTAFDTLTRVARRDLLGTEAPSDVDL